MRGLLGLVVAAALVYGTSAQAMPKPVLPPAVQVPVLPPNASHQHITFTRAVFNIPEGQVWARWGSATVCDFLTEDVRWNAANQNLDGERYSSAFNDELSKAGFTLASTNLFETNNATNGLQAAALIKDVRAQFCTASEDGTNATRVFRGILVITSEWQIYDTLKREVVARIETTAGAEQRKLTDDGVPSPGGGSK